MDCNNCVKKELAEQIELIGKEIKKRIENGTQGQSQEILELAQAQSIMIDTRSTL